MKKENRILVISIIITSLLLFLNGCQRQNYNERSDDLISIALGSAPSSIDPVRATDATGMRLVSLIYQSLLRVGDNLKPIGDLANKWSLEMGTHSFYISKQTKFSDGSPLTCLDLKSSIEAYQAKTCPFNAAFKSINNIQCSTSLDENNIVLSFKVDTDPEKFLLADLPVLKITKIQNKKKLGTGAFTIKENMPTHTLLQKNPNHLRAQTYDIKMFYLKDDLARFLKVLNGEIDIAPNSIPFEKVRAFKKTKMSVLEKPSLSTAYLLVNFKNKNLRSLEARKKIYQALNIPELVEYRFDNHVTLAKSLLFPEHPYYSPNLKNISHEDSNTKIKILKLNFKTSNARQTRETGKIISHKLRKSGIDVDLKSFEWGTYYKDVKGGRYDLALMKWVGVVDPDLYNLAFHSSEFPPGRNRGYYTNKDLDSVLERGRAATTTAGRFTSYHRAQEIVFQNLAIIPLWHENQIHIVHPRIENYKLNPMGDFTSFLNLNINTETSTEVL